MQIHVNSLNLSFYKTLSDNKTLKQTFTTLSFNYVFIEPKYILNHHTKTVPHLSYIKITF